MCLFFTCDWYGLKTDLLQGMIYWWNLLTHWKGYFYEEQKSMADHGLVWTGVDGCMDVPVVHHLYRRSEFISVLPLVDVDCRHQFCPSDQSSKLYHPWPASEKAGAASHRDCGSWVKRKQIRQGDWKEKAHRVSFLYLSLDLLLYF